MHGEFKTFSTWALKVQKGQLDPETAHYIIIHVPRQFVDTGFKTFSTLSPTKKTTTTTNKQTKKQSKTWVRLPCKYLGFKLFL